MEESNAYSPEQVEALGENLRHLLTEKIQNSGIAQQRLARVTRISQPALSRFVNGASLKLETVAVLLDCFGLEIRPKEPDAPKPAKKKPGKKKVSGRKSS